MLYSMAYCIAWRGRGVESGLWRRTVRSAVEIEMDYSEFTIEFY